MCPSDSRSINVDEKVINDRLIYSEYGIINGREIGMEICWKIAVKLLEIGTINVM